MKLAVEVVRAHGLTSKVRSRGAPNAFVEATFDGRHSRTLTKHNDPNPSWNETLVFDIANHFELVDRTVDLNVYHDRSSSDVKQPRSLIGRVRLSWSSVAPSSLDAPVQLYPLEKRGLFNGGGGGGELALRLYFISDYVDAAAAADGVPPGISSIRSPGRTNGYTPMSPESVRSEDSDASDVRHETPRQSPRTRNLHSVGAASKHGAKSDTNHERAQHSRPGTRFFRAEPAAAPPKVELQPPPPPQPQHSRPATRFFRAEPAASPPKVAVQPPPPPPPPPPTMLKPVSVEPTPPPPTPSNSDYGLIKTKPNIAALTEKAKYLGFLFRGGNEKFPDAYDLVEQTQYYLYVNIVQARELPGKDVTGSLDPYVEVKVGNYKNKTKHIVKNQDPEWKVVFAFSQEHQQSNQLEVIVKDKDLVVDDFVGKVVLELVDVPLRVPPNGPVAPQWYPLMDKKGESIVGRARLMLAAWKGTQADEMYPYACHSDALGIEAISQTRSKVYFTPRMCYLRVLVIEAQDLLRTVAAAPVVVKIELGSQIRFTSLSPPSSGNPAWNQELMFVGYDPFDELLKITVMERVDTNKDVPVAQLWLPKSEIKTHPDNKKLPGSRWYELSRPDSNGNEHGGGHKSKLHLRVVYDASFHVLDEPIPFSSDFHPSQRSMRRKSIGVLDLGILEAKNLLATRPGNGNGKGPSGASAYCVAKYGPKWVRTRTVVNTPSPRWQEQYSWEVHEPYTVLTIAVFDNWHVHGNNNGGSDAIAADGKDKLLGKIRIRLSTLDFGRVYTYYYPLLAIHPAGLKKTGELHLAFRFTCTDWPGALLLYTQHLLPKTHYTLPISQLHMKHLLHHAMQISVSKLARAEPPLRREVVEAILDVRDQDAFSTRKSKANYQRIKLLFAGVLDLFAWFRDVQEWKSPSVSILLHVLLVILVWSPDLILPTVFLYLFALCAWNYRYRPRDPPHYDARLSQADTATWDEFDEEFDIHMSMKTDDIVAHRYMKLRSAGWKVQSMMGDLANHGERIYALWSWRDPRATFMFLVYAAMAAAFSYVVPPKLRFVMYGFYLLRHPKLRGDAPSPVLNFFKRLPGQSDMLL